MARALGPKNVISHVRDSSYICKNGSQGSLLLTYLCSAWTADDADLSRTASSASSRVEDPNKVDFSFSMTLVSVYSSQVFPASVTEQY